MKPYEKPQSRGDFFRNAGKLFAGFIAEQVEGAVLKSVPVHLRPPGALDEIAFLATCTRCDRCIQACPQNALVRADSTAGLAFGTPILEPRKRPCFLCTHLPCVPACPEGALQWPTRDPRPGCTERRSGPEAVQIGRAVVHPDRCLTWPGTYGYPMECRICVDHCPYPEQALAIKPNEDGPGHPQVDPEICTGCGQCEYHCPLPEPAITVHKESD